MRLTLFTHVPFGGAAHFLLLPQMLLLQSELTVHFFSMAHAVLHSRPPQSTSVSCLSFICMQIQLQHVVATFSSAGSTHAEQKFTLFTRGISKSFSVPCNVAANDMLHATWDAPDDTQTHT